jgi:hypothetical protein
VTIQGFGFYPDSDIIVTIGGLTASTVRSDSDGQFTTTIYTPVTGEGSRNIAAYDPTGNVAVATFFTEFGFDSLQQSQQEIRDELAALQAQIDGMTGGTPAAAASPIAGGGSSLPPTPSPTGLPEPPATSTAPGGLVGRGVSLPSPMLMTMLVILALGAAYTTGRRAGASPR